ncbi:hypothetical protein B0T26DRAFT_678831 [Lasiosphaeria miniovina]|uniref:HNH nuclease domain-containing protein n=1 Tax=Lasiosphaeria miniovina TaxID=1954250 RepID=A0AA40A4X3_9PEZI|nr:uncharacterized protein B0T26DRAFT_678831 [Lasiosphaeria miniovina]KAK0709406.1 hypothetical protein B0T26DRAFT_678831 [Lasiosphaeria miniovina]
MDWVDPLRHLAPISKHPAKESTVLSSELSTISDQELASLKVNVKLDRFGLASARHNRAACILGTFFQFLEDDGRKVLAAEILAWIDIEDNLFELANHLVAAILLPLKASGGKAPPPISRPSIFADEDNEIEQTVAFIEPSRRDQIKLKRQCLRYFDRRSVKDKEVTLPQKAKCGRTECTHIIPFALGNFNEKDSLETENKALIWWTLYRYFPALQGKIDPASINQLGNLSFWPQEDVLHSYEANLMVPQSCIKSKSGYSIICLEQHDADIPMPDPECFKVHHIISQILETLRGILAKSRTPANLAKAKVSQPEQILSRDWDGVLAWRPGWRSIG